MKIKNIVVIVKVETNKEAIKNGKLLACTR